MRLSVFTDLNAACLRETEARVTTEMYAYKNVYTDDVVSVCTGVGVSIDFRSTHTTKEGVFLSLPVYGVCACV